MHQLTGKNTYRETVKQKSPQHLTKARKLVRARSFYKHRKRNSYFIVTSESTSY